jgi:hypothetical protein
MIRDGLDGLGLMYTLAQVGDHFDDIHEVTGSIPVRFTNSGKQVGETVDTAPQASSLARRSAT